MHVVSPTKARNDHLKIVVGAGYATSRPTGKRATASIRVTASKPPVRGEIAEGPLRSDFRPRWFYGPGHYLLSAGFYAAVGAVLQTLIMLLTP